MFNFIKKIFFIFITFCDKLVFKTNVLKKKKKRKDELLRTRER